MPKGSRPGERRGGRKPGVPNKMTADLRAAIENAFHEVGGQKYLVRVANEDPKTFCALLGKVLPLQVTGANGSPIQFVIETGVPRAD